MYALHKPMKGLFQHEDILSLEPLLNELKNKKLFITGGTGYVGKCLLDLIIKADKELNLNLKVDMLTRDIKKFQKEFPLVKELKLIQYIEKDINELSNEDTNDNDFIIHAANPASSQERINLLKTKPELLLETITEGTRKIIDLCKKNKQVKCLYISSGAVYNDFNKNHLLKESDFISKDFCFQSDIQALDPYTLGKRLSEKMFFKVLENSEFSNFSIARCFSFIGPYLPINSGFLGSCFFKNISEQESITINNTSEIVMRSFMHSFDLSIWLLNILIQGQAGEIYNVGSEKVISVEDLAKKVSKYFGNYSIYRKEISSEGSNKKYYLPYTLKARSELGLDLKYKSIEEIIASAASWYRL